MTLLHKGVTLAVSLERNTGYVLFAGDALTAEEASYLALRLWDAAHGLDVLLAANTPGDAA